MNTEPRTRNHELGTTNREQRTTNLDALRIAILGAGEWGKNHVRVFCELLGPDRVVVCDTDPDRRADAERAHPGVSTCATPDFASIDAAVVATPVSTHFSIARELLSHDVHVLVEKPMTLETGQARTLIETAERGHRILMVDHLLEYHPAIVRFKELIEQGDLGHIYYVTSRRLNLGVIRTDENALWSLAPHDISVILYLLGQEPNSISAQGATFLQDGIPDVACLTMEFEDGTFAHIHVSWLAPVKTRSLTLVGEHAMAVYDDMAASKLVIHDKRAKMEGGRYVPQLGNVKAVAIDANEPLQAVAEAFLKSIRTGKGPRTDGHDGLRVVRVLEAAQLSLKTRKIVELSSDLRKGKKL